MRPLSARGCGPSCNASCRRPSPCQPFTQRVQLVFACPRGFDDTRWARLSVALKHLSKVTDGREEDIALNGVVDCEETCDLVLGAPPLGSGKAAARAAEGGGAAPAAARAAGGAADAAVRFEVSEKTGRVHVHGSDGPIGSVLPEEAMHGGATVPFPADVREALARFAYEFAELSAMRRRRLTNRILPTSIAEALEDLEAKGARGLGEAGVGVARELRLQDAGQLVAGEGCRRVVVELGDGEGATEQLVEAEGGARLCLECGRVVADVPPVEPGVGRVVASGRWELFCGSSCTRSWRVRSSSACYRRALFQVERGVCTACGVDADALARRLRTIAKGDARWEQRRRTVLLSWPRSRFGDPAYGKLADALVRSALDGAAWQADHRRPVFQGGGGCAVENLRTLCSCCHMDVTAEQARMRAEARRAASKARTQATRRRKRADLAGDSSFE